MNNVTVECRLEPVLRGPKVGLGRATISMSGREAGGNQAKYHTLKFKVIAPVEDLPNSVMAWIVAHINRVKPLSVLCNADDFDVRLVMHSRLPKKVPVADPTKLMFPEFGTFLKKGTAEAKAANKAWKKMKKAVRPLGKKFPLR